MSSSPAAPVFRLLLLITLLLARADALLLSGDGPSSRRAKLSEWARLAAGGIAVASSAVALASHPKLKQWGGGPELSLYSDDLATARQLAALQSSNDMAPSRRRLEAEWAELRTRRVSRAEAEAAFATVLRARKAVAAAEAAVRDSRWAAVDAALPLRIVGELETAATAQPARLQQGGPRARARGTPHGPLGAEGRRELPLFLLAHRCSPARRS
jgi:hypothetical protein